MFTKASLVKDVLSTEGILEEVEVRIGQKIPRAMLAMVRNMTLEKVAMLYKLNQAQTDEALHELNRAAALLSKK